MSKIIVIGSNSFSGSSFVDFILSKKFRVIGLSRSNEYKDVFLRYRKNKNINNFKFYKLDINKDFNKICALIKKEKPEYIINFAAQGMVNESWDRPTDWYNTNFISQVKLFEFLKGNKFLKKYIHFTTPEVYGNLNNWKKESFIFNPSTPYALSRAASDMHLKNLFDAYNFPVIFTRAANVYGEGQQLYRIVIKAMLFFRLGEMIDLHGGGHSKRSFIHIDDVSNALFKIINKGKLGNTYHISSKKIISIKSLLRQISKMMNVDYNKLVKKSEDRRGKDHSYKLDSLKIRNELYWSDKITLDTGLRQTLIWVDQNIDMLKKLPNEYVHKK